MLGSSKWKNDLVARLKQLETEVSELRKTNIELKSQTSKILQIVKNMGKKLVGRLPISIESLEKGLSYDLIFWDEIEAWKASVSGGILLDTRPAHEFAKSFVPEAYNIPFDQLNGRLETLPKDRPILLICENGIKSAAASELLTARGYSFIYVLKGGMSTYQGAAASRESSEASERSEAASL